MSPKPPKLPLITIVGSTATGKSNLAIALASRFNGEIINSDAIQLYKGLPIATNKVRPGDMRGVPHHLLGCIGLDEPTWTVGTYVQAADKVIREIRSRGRLPIVVGGTHYYVQSLLFQGLSVSKPEGDHLSTEEMEEKWPVLKEGNEAILKELRRVDPAMAERWHPNDSRKIRRSLEIWLETGRKSSELYANQRTSALLNPDATKLPPGILPSLSKSGLSIRDSLIFWIHGDQAVLDERIRSRVDQMIGEGLLDEISELSALLQGEGNSAMQLDMSKGIWAAIGYKEFAEYMNELHSHAREGELMRLKADAIERIKIATRQYAKRQTRWIRLKLLPSVMDAQVQDYFFVLDCNRIETWHDDVEKMACVITDDYLASKPMPDPKAQSEIARSLLGPAAELTSPNENHIKNCQLCSITVTTTNDWENHVSSRRHKKIRSTQCKASQRVDTMMPQDQKGCEGNVQMDS